MMFSRLVQERRSRESGWAFRAVLLTVAAGCPISIAHAGDETDLPAPLAETLREAGIISDAPRVAPPRPVNPARSAAPARVSQPVRSMKKVEKTAAPARVPTPELPAAAPVAAPAPVVDDLPLLPEPPAPAAESRVEPPAPAPAPTASVAIDDLPPLPDPAASPASATAPAEPPAPSIPDAPIQMPAVSPIPAPVEPTPAPAAPVDLPPAPAPVEPTPAPAPVEPTPAPAAPVEPTPVAEETMELPPLPEEVPTAVDAPAASPMPAAAVPAVSPEPVAPESAPAPAVAQDYSAPVDSSVAQASCPSCGHKLHTDGYGGYAGCGSCGRGGQCVPGQKGCNGMAGCDQHFGCRFFGNLYDALACPDPCYQPSWIPEANAAFFQDYARPRTLTRLRWDHGWQMRYPDRNEFFWARQSNGNGGAGPKFPPSGFRTGRPNSIYGQTGVNFDQLYFYTEAANEKGSLFFEIPYRSNNPTYGPSMSGFADLNFGSKSLLFDTELLQVTFQFRSFMPSGQASKGLGTAHVSLEPSLMFSMRLAPEAYLQGQFAEWIPLGGDSTYAGALMHYHLSYNQVLWRPVPDAPIMGTFEFNGWSFQDGAYTDPSRKAPVTSSGDSYLNLGTGLRMSVADKIDFGGAIAWPLNNEYWANPLLRFEFRILY
ncbi:MAG: hypothetical protein SFX72_21930 [Isosphaeraceae bacterium]|nr:hypothetical protein [Isosphaeraceae bacterium]